MKKFIVLGLLFIAPTVMAFQVDGVDQGLANINNDIDMNGNTISDVVLEGDGAGITNLTIGFGGLSNVSVTVDNAADNDTLIYDLATKTWSNAPPAAGVGEANTITSVGASTSLVSGKVGVDLQVKSLKPGDGIELVGTSSNVTITVTGLVTKTEFQETNNIFRVDIDSLVAETNKYLQAGSTNNLVETFSSVGAGTSVLSGKVGVDLQFKSLIPGSGITFTDSPTQVTISAAAGVGEANTISSVGASTSLVSGKVGVDLQIKSLKPGDGIEISSTSSNVTITVTGLVSQTEFQTSNNVFRVDIDSLVNETSKYLQASATNNIVESFSSVGTGTSILSGKVDSDLQFKTLEPGANITITDTGSNLVFASVGSSGGWTDDGTTVRLTTITDSVGIGTTGPDASSILHLVSTNKGFLPPRMTSVQRLAIPSPAEGLIVYDTTVSNFFGHNGTKYVRLDLEMAGGCLFKSNTFAVGTGTVSLTFNVISEPLTNVTLIGGLGGSELRNDIEDQVTYNLEPQFNRFTGGGIETIVVWYEISTNSGVSWIKGESIMKPLQSGESTVAPLTACVVGNGKRVRFRTEGTDADPSLEFIALAAGEKTPNHPIIPAYILTID